MKKKEIGKSGYIQNLIIVSKKLLFLLVLRHPLVFEDIDLSATRFRVLVSPRLERL